MHKKNSSDIMIRFRLDASTKTKCGLTLAEKATEKAKRHGVSVHELAHDAFVYLLDDVERQEFVEALGQSRREICQLRADLKQSVIAILCDAGKLEREDAEDWVNKNLFQ